MKSILQFLFLLPVLVNAQTTIYDDLNRPSQITYPNNVVVNIQWDAAGNPIQRVFMPDVVTPVELLSFKAWPETEGGNKSQLEWRTVTEENTDMFIIEWSTNGNLWTDMDTVSAVGNTTEEQVYEATHQKPIQGNNYYRLRIVDFDKTYEYSNVQVVTFTEDESFSLNLFPNPVDKYLNAEILGDGTKFKLLGIYDISGKKIENVTTQKDGQLWKLDVSNLLEGIYMITFQNGEKELTKKFVR